MLNTRIASNISSISLPREFYLNNRAYNIPSKIINEHIKRKNRDKNKILYE